MNGNTDKKSENRFLRFIDNYWYHHKWAIIGITFALIVILICTLQMCEGEKEDLSVVYAGPDSFMVGDRLTNIHAALKTVLPEDYNGDGTKHVEWISYYVMSDEEIKYHQSEAEKIGEEYYYNSAVISENLKNFQNIIVSGEYSLCFLSPYLYEMVKRENGFTPLSEIFDEVPDAAVDEYGVRLSETEFGKYFPGISELPEDTVICLRRVGGIGALLRKSKNEKENAQSAELFRAIVAFKAEE
ncbi:MAG: hypothetical protein ACI4QZ_06055 [Eubacteriales bacterium]